MMTMTMMMMVTTTMMWCDEIVAPVGRLWCVAASDVCWKMVIHFVNAADVMDMERNDGENVVDVKLNRRHY